MHLPADSIRCTMQRTGQSEEGGTGRDWEISRLRCALPEATGARSRNATGRMSGARRTIRSLTSRFCLGRGPRPRWRPRMIAGLHSVMWVRAASCASLRAVHDRMRVWQQATTIATCDSRIRSRARAASPSPCMTSAGRRRGILRSRLGRRLQRASSAILGESPPSPATARRGLGRRGRKRAAPRRVLRHRGEDGAGGSRGRGPSPAASHRSPGASLVRRCTSGGAILPATSRSTTTSRSASSARRGRSWESTRSTGEDDLGGESPE